MLSYAFIFCILSTSGYELLVNTANELKWDRIEGVEGPKAALSVVHDQIATHEVR